ncbi:sucrose-6-phosphate hydrolase [Vibrio maritimus]|uniref:beta-fructofuranosidase n=1 Tax=Vibrio maritimus TaxID=990268 RepID=A0A090RYS1_9VIBR|nr:sucrose-6-phosphate hydrolase [Vibrio maritimus]
MFLSPAKNWVDNNGKKTETFDVTAHIGDFSHQSASFDHDDGMLMDHGFDFYAPQTFEDENGRRILFGWMGKPDEFEPLQPTIEQGWIHQMTCPRELTLFNNKLRQQPSQELMAMRRNERRFRGLSTAFEGLSAELQLNGLDGKTLTIEVADDLKIEISSSGLNTTRRNLKTKQWESIEWKGKVRSLQLLRDASSLEVFINEGEGVSTSRFFGQGFGVQSACGFAVQSEQEISATHWTLEA